jgi:hypothetical protein
VKASDDPAGGAAAHDQVSGQARARLVGGHQDRVGAAEDQPAHRIAGGSLKQSDRVEGHGVHQPDGALVVTDGQPGSVACDGDRFQPVTEIADRQGTGRSEQGRQQVRAGARVIVQTHRLFGEKQREVLSGLEQRLRAELVGHGAVSRGLCLVGGA